MTKRWNNRGRLSAEEKLIKALEPFVAAYEKDACPVGDSDLYNEQPRSVRVTLGDCRRAASVLRDVKAEVGL